MICTQCTHVILYYIVRCDDRQDQVGWYGNAVLSHSSPFLSFLMLIRTFRWWLGHNFDIVIWASVTFLFSGSPCGAPHHVGGHLQDGPRLGDVRLAGGRLHLPALLGPRDRLHAPAHAPPHRPLRWGHSDLQILPPRARRSLWRECSACVQYEWCGRGRIREGCYAWQDHFPHPQLTLKTSSRLSQNSSSQLTVGFSLILQQCMQFPPWHKASKQNSGQEGWDSPRWISPVVLQRSSNDWSCQYGGCRLAVISIDCLTAEMQQELWWQPKL